MFDRYAIYYSPPANSELAEFGARWLGWDINKGAKVDPPTVPGLPQPIASLTDTPRKYGFHGTMKAPFYLNKGQTEDSLISATETFADAHSPFEIGRFSVSNLGSFVALTEVEPNPKLADFTSKCVMELDHLRAPLSKEDIARRMQANLTPRQEHLMRTWGYPYILEEFRFHLTLTGRLETELVTDVTIALRDVLDPLLREPLRLDDICLCGQAKTGRFEVIRRFPLKG